MILSATPCVCSSISHLNIHSLCMQNKEKEEIVQLMGAKRFGSGLMQLFHPLNVNLISFLAAEIQKKKRKEK